MKIFVSLQSLWSSGAEIISSGGQLQQAGSTLQHAGNSAPSYEGQFRPWVQTISSDGNARLKSMSAEFTDLGVRVGRKADAFCAADGLHFQRFEAERKVFLWYANNRFLALSLGFGFGVMLLSDTQWKRLLAFVRLHSPNELRFFLVLAPPSIAKWYGKTFEKPKPPSKPPEQQGKQFGVDKVTATISSLNVERTARYAPQGDKTYCNIFVMDLAKRLNVPLPEFLDPNKDGKIDVYLNANQAVSWLRGDFSDPRAPSPGLQGPELGWSAVGENKAAELASKGYVVVAGWINPVSSSPGHMAFLRPESRPGNILIAQAGATNFSSGPLSKGFGNRKVEFFAYKPPIK